MIGTYVVVAEKYSRLSTANSNENLLDVEVPPKIQNQTIFGVPIPFTRKSDRNDKYHKVPVDSDNDSLCNKDENRSSDEELLDKTLKTAHSKRLEHEHSSNSSSSGTLTRTGQLAQGPLNNGDSGGYRPHSCDSNYSSTITPPASSSENLSDPFGAAPFTAKEDSTANIKIDQSPVPLLSNNPFLSDIISQGHVTAEGETIEAPSDVQTSAQHEHLRMATADEVQLAEQRGRPTDRVNELSFSDFASQRTVTAFHPSSSHSLQDFSNLPTNDLATAADHKPPTSRMQKSKTLDSVQMRGAAAGDPVAQQLPQGDAFLKHSQTDYEVGLKDVEFEMKDEGDEMLDSETLLADQYGSLRKKDKTRKSPKISKSVRTPRHSDPKRSLAYTGSLECEGALTNEAFSEIDSNTAKQDLVSDKSNVPPKPAAKPHPPTAPKPSVDRRPPISMKPATKSSQEHSHQSGHSETKTPTKNSTAEVKLQAKSETKAPSTSAKDPYKTHKRYSSYDLATGRAELSICNDSDSSKSALVSKEGKTKKKTKIGLGIF